MPARLGSQKEMSRFQPGRSNHKEHNEFHKVHDVYVIVLKFAFAFSLGVLCAHLRYLCVASFPNQLLVSPRVIQGNVIDNLIQILKGRPNMHLSDLIEINFVGSLM